MGYQNEVTLDFSRPGKPTGGTASAAGSKVGVRIDQTRGGSTESNVTDVVVKPIRCAPSQVVTMLRSPASWHGP